MHLREQILQAVQSALTGLATTGSHVYRNRVYREERHQLPSLNIVQEADVQIDQEAGQIAFGFYDRRLTIRLEARVSETEAAGVDTVLNRIEEETHIALQQGAVTAIPGARRLWLLATDEPETSAEGEQPLAMMAIRWAVDYRTLYDDPSRSN